MPVPVAPPLARSIHDMEGVAIAKIKKELTHYIYITRESERDCVVDVGNPSSLNFAGNLSLTLHVFITNTLLLSHG
jgi:hypothetical protein